MQFKDAAYEILKSSGKPLHYNAITDKAGTEGIPMPPSPRIPARANSNSIYTKAGQACNLCSPPASASVQPA